MNDCSFVKRYPKKREKMKNNCVTFSSILFEDMIPTLKIYVFTDISELHQWFGNLLNKNRFSHHTLVEQLPNQHFFLRCIVP